VLQAIAQAASSRQLALENVERLVEIVMVEGRANSRVRSRLDHADLFTAFFAAEQHTGAC
jgi:hypothetical protein